MSFPRALRTRKGRSFAIAPTLAPLAFALGLASICGSATAAWTDGQAATLVLGADDFTTAGGGAASASRLTGPTDVCADSATGKVFVIVYGQNRILRFSAAEAVKNGGAAEAVFGQPDFISVTINNGGLSAKSLYRPMTCAIDAAGRLFVTDDGNKRVLRFDNAATKPSFAPADGVLGQADFTSMATGTAANRLGSSNLYGIALDASGNLYVSDGNNKRVLRFDNAASKANGANADGVLGAANLTTVGAGGVTASTFSTSIYGLTLDAAGNLYVSDAGNRRILRFDNAAAKANGAAADGVLGAPDMTTMGSGTASSSTMTNVVYGIDVLADGALYAADFSYNRVLIFSDPAHKANGAAADHVLGQSDFTSTSSGLTATGLNSPLGLGYNAPAGYLMIPNYGSHRVVGHFSESLKPNAAPTASGVAISSTTPAVGQQLTGSYTYADANNDPEGASTFVWKRGSTPIGGATALQYTPVTDDAGQALTFCVTPVASAGTASGVQTCSAPTAPVAVAPLNGACGAAAGQPTALLPATGLCSVGTPSAVASASGRYTWQCQGLNGGSATSCQAPWASAGGGNSATVVLQTGNNWQVNSASFSTTPPAPAPQGVSFPAGLLALNLSSGTQGSDATVTLHFSTPVPAGAVYMKYGPSPDGFNCQGTTACAQPHWYQLPADRVQLANDRLSATLTLTDGGLGDFDGVANQFIQDPGGFAMQVAPASAMAIPTLNEWGLALLSLLAATLGLRAARRRG